MDLLCKVRRRVFLPLNFKVFLTDGDLTHMETQWKVFLLKDPDNRKVVKTESVLHVDNMDRISVVLLFSIVVSLLCLYIHANFIIKPRAINTFTC